MTEQVSAESPLSYAQQRLWFLDRLEPGNVQYLVPWAWRLSGPLDPARLTAALRYVVGRHEVLRTRITERDGEPVQVVQNHVDVEVPLLDSAGWEVDEHIAELMEQPFDLGVAPLWRVRLLRLGQDEHVLITIWHHAVIDAWSAEILLREVSTAYRAGLAGADPGLPPLRRQYRDYARAQRDRLAGPEAAGQLAYWRENLAGVPPLDLPTDRPRARVRATEGDAVLFLVPDAVVAGLRELARDRQVTLFMVLLAAFQTLLARHTGQDDLAVGTPLANRNHGETEPLIGFFLNTLVLRTDLSGDPTFAELLHRVRTTTLNAYENEDLPFERLVESLRPERDLARTPLFQAMFIVNNVRVSGWDLPQVRAEEYPLSVGRAKFDLSVGFREGAERLDGFLRYSTALFDRDRIERMAGQLGNLLAAVVADPDLPLSRLPMLGEEERSALLHEWNGAGEAGETREIGTAGGVHELVRARAAERPDAIALCEQDGAELSYGELDAWANRLARRLRERGARAETIVAILLPTSIRAVVTMLAVLKSGAAYLALDPDLPMERTRLLLGDSGAGLLVTDTPDTVPAEFTDRVLSPADPADPADTANPVDTVDSAATDPGDPGVPVYPGSLAYLAYTSGSSGVPKAVLATHGGVRSHLRFLHREYRLGPGDTVLTLAGLGFDASVREIFGALGAGARLVLPARRDPDTVLALAAAAGVTVLPSVVPSLLYELAAIPVPDGALDRVRLVLCAGEKLSADRLGPCDWLAGKVVNQFGPTEATMTTTRHPLPAADGSAYPVGRPVDGARVYVLDGRLNPCPIGVPGELFIGGAGVARGYHRRPGATAAAFVADPFGHGGRLYRTGDRCRWSAAGVLEFLGRADDQVKIRGIRVEPGEAQARLRAHPDVADAVVLARELPSGGTGLVGYVVPGERRPGRTELRNWSAAVLPAQLVPYTFVTLERFPLTRNGKVDRSALAALDTRRNPQRPSRAPHPGIEDVLARIWRRHLRLDRVGAHDDFFELGGHSLLAGRVVADLAAAGVRLPLSALFETPVLAGMAARCTRSPEAIGLLALNAAAPDNPALPGAGHGPVLYCVHDGAGELTGYRTLATLLPPGYRMIGIEFTPGQDSPTIEALARRYLELIRRGQPRGPYAICGWSLGGLLAYELAALLARAGEPAVAAYLIDTAVPDPGSAPQREADEVLRRAIEWRADEEYPAAPGRRELLRALGVAEIPPDPDGAVLDELLARMGTLQAAKRAYRPEPAGLDLTVLRAESSHWPAEQFRRWREFVPTATLHEVAGDHLGVLDGAGARLCAEWARERLG